jgi:hypothetical protein
MMQYIHEIQDNNTPAVVSLAAGGIAGGVEGFLSVCRNGELQDHFEVA